MKTVDVLLRIDPFDDRLLRDVARKRQLHEDPVDGRIVIESIDVGEQLTLADARRQVDGDRAHADRLGGAALVAYVEGGSSMFADLHDGEPGRGLALRHPARYARADVGRHFVGEAPAVENSRGHKIAA